MLRRIYSILVIGLGCLLLVSCAITPKQLGFSDQAWQALSDHERAHILNNYQDMQRHVVKNKTIYQGPPIVVRISRGAQGTAMMPPFTEPQPFHVVQFTIKAGECSRVRLNSIDGNHHVVLPVCYNGLTLALDPSRYDPQFGGGSLRFNYNPLWQRGFAYQGISSSGYVRLTQVTVTIDASAESIVPPTMMHDIAPAAQSQTQPFKPSSVESAVPKNEAPRDEPKTVPLSPLAPVEDIANTGI